MSGPAGLSRIFRAGALRSVVARAGCHECEMAEDFTNRQALDDGCKIELECAGEGPGFGFVKAEDEVAHPREENVVKILDVVSIGRWTGSGGGRVLPTRGESHEEGEAG